MMKTLQLKTLPLLLLEIPNSAKHTQHSPGTIIRYRGKDCELIGKLSELPEEWFEQYVEFGDSSPSSDVFIPGYLYYSSDEDDIKDFICKTPRESFYSLLEAKEQVYLNGNPCGDEAQSRTFDPYRTYVFTVKT